MVVCLLFCFLTTAMSSGSFEALELCCISTQLGDVCQRRCLFSLTLSLPRLSFSISFFFSLLFFSIGSKCEQSPSTWNFPAASGVLWRFRSEGSHLHCQQHPLRDRAPKEVWGRWAKLEGSRLQSDARQRPLVFWDNDRKGAARIINGYENPSCPTFYLLIGPLCDSRTCF